MDGRARDALLRRLGSALVHAERAGELSTTTTIVPPPTATATATPAPAPWRPPRASTPPPAADVARTQRADSAAQRRAREQPTSGVYKSKWGASSSSAEAESDAKNVDANAAVSPLTSRLEEARAKRAAPLSPLSPPPPVAAATMEVPIVIVFDLETTGLAKLKDRIIEIAAYDLNDKTHAPMSTLVNPGRTYLTGQITRLTGITNAMVSNPGVPSFVRAAELLEEFVDEARRRGAFYTLVPIRPRRRGERRSLRTFASASLRPPPAFNPRPRRLSTPPDAFELHPDIGGGASVILAAHNARQFDAGFLKAEYDRIQREFPDDWRFVDTLPIARKLVPKTEVFGSHKMEALATRYDVKPVDGETAHRAGADARVLGEIVEAMLGVSFDATAGTSVSGVDGGGELGAAARMLASHSFSLGDTGKNNLRRKSSEAAAAAAAAAAKAHVAWPSTNNMVGTSPIATADGSDVARASAVAQELDELEAHVDGGDDDDAFESKKPPAMAAAKDDAARARPARKPFWLAADPITGFVPETREFARLVEAGEAASTASSRRTTRGCVRITRRGRVSRSTS
jgi:DNA polymerase III epsilon subunit-like protein